MFHLEQGDRNMKKAELLPTYPNILESFQQDAIGRNVDLLYFVKLLNSINGAYSIALDGRWGSGKTFFVLQAKMIFESFNKFTQMKNEITEDDRATIETSWTLLQRKANEEYFDPSLHVCVYYDAWEHDADDEPVASLIYEISKTATSGYEFEGERDYLSIAASIIDLISGRDHKSLVEALKASNITDSIKEQQGIREKINEYFDELLPEHGDRLIIFVDELDRCNPRYAVKLLERIKHYFAHDKITFVFSVNMDQLQHTVKQHYGQDFNAHKYLDRFFDFVLPVPKIDMSKFYQSIGTDLSLTINRVANATVRHYNMEMREVAKYFDTLKVATQKRTSDLYGTPAKDFCFYVMLPIAIGLHKHDISLYDTFTHGKDATPLEDIMMREEMVELMESYFFKNTEDIDSYDEAARRNRIKETYNALFKTGVNGAKRITVGGIPFESSVYQYFTKIIGMLNKTATFE